MDVCEQICAYLDSLHIPYEMQSHALAETMDDLREVARTMQAVIPKNLFLTPRNKSRYYLYLVEPDAVFHTAELSKKIGSSRLSFGDGEALDGLLRTHAGAISPLGLIFDTARATNLLIDSRFRDVARLGFHPNDNTKTVAMAASDFFDVFLPNAGFTPRFME